MIENILIFVTPALLVIGLKALPVSLNNNFNYIVTLNLELTFYLAVIAIMPLFDIFRSMNKVKVDEFNSLLDQYIKLIVKGFIILFITYFLYSFSFIKFEGITGHIYNYLFLYLYFSNLIIFLLVIKKFLKNIQNSNLS